MRIVPSLFVARRCESEETELVLKVETFSFCLWCQVWVIVANSEILLYRNNERERKCGWERKLHTATGEHFSYLWLGLLQLNYSNRL